MRIVPAAVAVLAVLGVVSGCEAMPDDEPEPDPVSWLTGRVESNNQVLAVKIDNTASARPQLGVADADVVYVEEVEGGLTRLLAVFASTLPEQVGPVRSARTSDLLILGNYGSAGFAYSGGNAGVLDEVAASGLATVSFDSDQTGYVRATDRPAPYNVIGDPAALLGRVPEAAVATDIGFRFGEAPAGGTPVEGASYAWPGARIDVGWSDEAGGWLITMDGAVTAEPQPAPANVIFQSVEVAPSGYVDSTGASSPEVRPVGEGDVTVLRNGQSYSGRWSRPAVTDPTTFTVETGGGDSTGAAAETLTLAPGPTWIVYTREGTTPTLAPVSSPSPQG